MKILVLLGKMTIYFSYQINKWMTGKIAITNRAGSLHSKSNSQWSHQRNYYKSLLALVLLIMMDKLVALTLSRYHQMRCKKYIPTTILKSHICLDAWELMSEQALEVGRTAYWGRYRSYATFPYGHLPVSKNRWKGDQLTGKQWLWQRRLNRVFGSLT